MLRFLEARHFLNTYIYFYRLQATRHCT